VKKAFTKMGSKASRGEGKSSGGAARQTLDKKTGSKNRRSRK
jgi:hypothetical protein